MCQNQTKVYLLHGVTGAGKTEVFLQAAQYYLNQGKQSLILVPEIALTPLLIGRVQARFGERVACCTVAYPIRNAYVNGGAFKQEKPISLWVHVRLYLPFPNLGLIIVDEEHDDSINRDGVRYHARDMAVVRGKDGTMSSRIGFSHPQCRVMVQCASQPI